MCLMRVNCSKLEVYLLLSPDLVDRVEVLVLFSFKNLEGQDLVVLLLVESLEVFMVLSLSTWRGKTSWSRCWWRGWRSSWSCP